MSLDSEQVLPRQHLLDIANQLASEGEYKEAASVYEKFLTHYANYEHIEQVELMLGIIYSRYLEKGDLALNHLRAAEKKIIDPAQLLMCRSEIEKLQKQ
jgi:outer membrane protein assembly factor BamD (BamD/ComL family)